jgi:hypothetical protein
MYLMKLGLSNYSAISTTRWLLQRGHFSTFTPKGSAHDRLRTCVIVAI